MNWFKNLKINAKLLLSFSVVILLLIFISAIGITRVRQINASYSAMLEYSVAGENKMNDAIRAYLSARRNSLAVMHENNEGNYQAMDALYSSFITDINSTLAHLSEYDRLRMENPSATDQAKQERGAMLQRVVSGLSDEYEPAFTDLYKCLKEERAAGSNDALEARMSESKKKMAVSTDIQNDMDAILDSLAKGVEESADENDKIASGAVLALVVISLIVVLLAVVLTMVVSSVIRKPLMEIESAMRDVAAGKFHGVRLRTNAKDEAGVLSNSAADVVDTFMRIIERVNIMAKGLNEGRLDSRIDAASFQGEYLEAVNAINAVVTDLCDDSRLAVKVTNELAAGNVKFDIPKLPGDKIVMTHAFEKIKGTVVSIIKDIETLVAAINNGSLKTSADSGKYVGAWSQVIEGVNSMLAAADGPISEIGTVLTEVSNGNLRTTVKGAYKGDFAKIAAATNITVETVNAYVTEISDVLTRMASQDLDIYIERDYIGDYAPIRVAFDTILNNFNELVKAIMLSSQEVGIGAKQVSNSSMDLAQNSTAQASSLEELSASISLIAQQTSNNAENADKADNLAKSAMETGIKGSAEMSNMLNSMNEINQASQSIGRIIKVIDDIAFQTNLLALNAAVEAARAGEHGKGFAVVAEEVRNLAGRSSTAAKETTELVENSIQRTDEGSKTANRTAEALSEIIEQIGDISHIIAEVSHESSEQSHGIGQINLGINQIATATQRNTATSEESAAGGQELASQAEVLNSLISGFKIRAK
jgi:methyl-accepting chemotaxis protein